MACITANFLILHKMNHVAHSCWLHKLPTILWFAPSRSNVVWLFTAINHSEQQPKSRVCEIQTMHSSTERMSADVCLKKSLGSYMRQMLNFMWWCMVSIAIPNVVTVKTQILRCSSRLSIPTSTTKTQLASMWSISSNIHYLVHQQSQHKIKWSMLQKRTFHHYRHANTANRQSTSHDDLIKRMTARGAWKLNGSEPLERCAACNRKRSLQWVKNEKLTSWATMRRRNGSRIMRNERPLRQDSKLKMQRPQLSRSGMIWDMLKTWDWQPPSLKQHLRRCWMRSEIVWAILHVQTMGRMAKTRMMMKMILWWASLGKDAEPGWVMGSIARMVQHCIDRFRQEKMKLDHLTQPGWGEAADYFRERDKKYGTTELKVPAVVQPQTADDATSSAP